MDNEKLKTNISQITSSSASSTSSNPTTSTGHKTTPSTTSTTSTTKSIDSGLYERRRNWRTHQMKSCMPPSTNFTLINPINAGGGRYIDSGTRITARRTESLQNKENWWRKTISHEPSVLITPFAQILAILNRARDFLSSYTSSSPLHSNNSNMFEMRSPKKSSETDEKYIDYLHRFDVHYVNDLLSEFDWCLEVLESLQCKCSVSSLTRMKFRTLLSQELAASFNQPDIDMNKESSKKTSNIFSSAVAAAAATSAALPLGIHASDDSKPKSSTSSSSSGDQIDYKISSKMSQMQRRKQQFAKNSTSQVCEYICRTFLEEDDDEVEVEVVGLSGDTTMSWKSTSEKSVYINSPKLKLRFGEKLDEMNESNESPDSPTTTTTTTTTPAATTTTTETRRKSSTSSLLTTAVVTTEAGTVTTVKSTSSSSPQTGFVDILSSTIQLITLNVELIDNSKVEKFIRDNQSTLAPDLFQLDQISNHHPLSTLGFYLFMKTNLLQKLSIPPVTMLHCLRCIESRYNPSAPFHNSIHALDVLHATYQLFQCNNLKNIFSDLEMFAIYFACTIHDIDHPGLTNQYLINTNHELALLYNDISVLENHHLHVAFKMISTEKECDFTQYLTNQQKQLFRKMVINLVLSTDMSKHMSLLADLKTTVEKQRALQGNVISLDSYSARMQILECVIHAADLSNPTKPLEIYQQWVSRIMEEMFRQGDQERKFGIEISPMCDRETACIYSTQIGFIDYIVYPLWETMAELLYPGAQILMENITKNRNWYASAKEIQLQQEQEQQQQQEQHQQQAL
uniref:Phosphodiesterase n=1 Tax=Trichobilharzia regenti TaxID=157069 RepID=A0AA85IV46_TRIRE|nr:unnamed protein product [Trichobilharzia regenti]